MLFGAENVKFKFGLPESGNCVFGHKKVDFRAFYSLGFE